MHPDDQPPPGYDQGFERHTRPSGGFSGAGAGPDPSSYEAYPGTYEAFPGGAYASEQNPYGTEQPSPQPPAEIVRSFQLWLAFAAINVIGMLVALFSMWAMRSEFWASIVNDPAFAEAQMDYAAFESMYLVSVVIAGVFVAACIGLHVLFIFKLRAGRNWARIVMTVFTALFAPLMLMSLLQQATLVSTIVNIVLAVVLAAAVYFMWTRPASDYLRPTPQQMY